MRAPARKFYDDVVLRHESDDCLIWPFAKNGIGYGVLGNKLVHRLVCERWSGPALDGMEAAHSCGNRACCNRRHLSWKTHKANMADMKAHGTVNTGSRNGASKLTEEDIAAIRSLASDATQREIAKAYGVNQATVSDIVRRESWAHV